MAASRKSLVKWLCFLAILSAATISCNNENSTRNDDPLYTYDHLNIVVNSPYSVFDEIHLKASGSANLIYGLSRERVRDSIVGRKSFSIDSSHIKQKISEIVRKIKARPPVLSPGAMDDGFQFILSIDDKKFVDKYGQDSLLDKILSAIAPYIQNEELGEADFFNLYKKGPGHWVDNNKITGTWAHIDSENATFVIGKDSIYYPETFTSYKYSVDGNTITIYYNDYVPTYRLKMNGPDTLIMRGDEEQVYYRFKN